MRALGLKFIAFGGAIVSGLAATTAPLAKTVRQRMGGASASGSAGSSASGSPGSSAGLNASAALVRVAHAGVHAADAPLAPRNEGTPFCAAISGGDAYDADYESLFTALRKIVDDYPDAQFFLDVPAANGHTLYRRVHKLNLLANLSMVPPRLGHRDDLLGAGVLIHPQAMGQSRSITLAAMARGIPVLARRDEWLDYLVDDQTAWLVDKPDARRWEELLRLLILAPGDAAAMGDRARQWVQANHAPSQQVAAILDLYRQVTGEAIKFPA